MVDPLLKVELFRALALAGIAAANLIAAYCANKLKHIAGRQKDMQKDVKQVKSDTAATQQTVNGSGTNDITSGVE